MIILLDTSTPVCKLTLVDADSRYEYEWQADRQLARGLLAYLYNALKDHDATWADITSIGVFKGPGSFTGLRIGITVANTLADTQSIQIVGSIGQAWQHDALKRLTAGENDRIVLPDYGGEAHITKPRK
jgi:tRNA threonylcarbamoyladenosine biosynthesis protein TsaB